jgi:hypothetical protein
MKPLLNTNESKDRLNIVKHLVLIINEGKI